MARRKETDGRVLAEALAPERTRVLCVLGVLLVALGLRLAMPAMLARFVDDAIAGRPLSALTAIAAGYVAAAVAAESLKLVVTWASVHVAWQAGNRLRERLAHHALRLDLAWHGRHSAGHLIERIDGDIESIVDFFTNVLVYVVGNALLLVGMLVVVFLIDPLAGALLLVSAGVGVTVLFRVRVAAVPARDAEREVNARLYGDLEERLGGLDDLRANGAGRYAVHKLHQHSALSWRAGRRAALVGDGSYAVGALTFALGSVAVLAAGFVLHGRGLVTVGQVLALFRYSEMLRDPLEQVAEQMKEFQKAAAGARRAARLLATETTVPESPPADARDVSVLPPGALAVDFDGVSFAYDAGDRLVLRDVELHLSPGTRIGIIGRTGSGKTTLGRLVLRLWDATEGTVLVGGVDVRRLPQASLRARVAVVTQDVELFRASVRDNLTLFGARAADDATLVTILERVGLGPWLTAQHAGLDTELAGTGSLSAGEAQLLALARALLTDPGVVVLDEASSRIDPDTEARIEAASRALLEGRTALVIAHRLATLETVDEIVVVDEGRIVEHGPRDVLAATADSRYARLLRLADHEAVLEELGP